MEYPIGSPTCWDENNTNCANRKEAQCNFGCVNRSGVEIKGMAAYDKGMRLMIDEGFHRGYKDPAPDLFGTTGWLPPSKMGGKFSATCWFYGQYLSSPPTPPPSTRLTPSRRTRLPLCLNGLVSFLRKGERRCGERVVRGGRGEEEVVSAGLCSSACTPAVRAWAFQHATDLAPAVASGDKPRKL